MSRLDLQDEQFFRDHGDRETRIRLPAPGENESDFQTLGPHQIHRRRIIAVRAHGAMAARMGIKVMRIPYLLFADETVEDTDENLSPIVDRLMREAAQQLGVGQTNGH
jgi:hypothetical protein